MLRYVGRKSAKQATVCHGFFFFLFNSILHHMAPNFQDYIMFSLAHIISLYSLQNLETVRALRLSQSASLHACLDPSFMYTPCTLK